MVRLALLLVALTLAGCGLEAPVVNAVLASDHRGPVGGEPQPVDLVVRAPGMPGAAVSALSAGGTALASPATADSAGEATLTFGPGVDHRFVRVVFTAGDRVVAAVVPRVPPAEGWPTPVADDRTLAQALVLDATAARLNVPLDVMDGVSVLAATAALVPGSGPAVDRVLDAVARAVVEGAPAVDPATLAVRDAALAAAVEAAAAAVRLTPCVDEERIRVIFQVEIRDGMVDANCAPLDPFLWAADLPDSTVFITGGVHEDQEGLSLEVTDPVSALLGNWEPNRAPLSDDGTRGDAVAGDNVWTGVFELPRTDPPLRLGYKYTFGRPGQGWTSTEEWPGNSRLLEVVDVDGDGRVVRFDHFADETTNKDKMNLRRGSVGVVKWDTDADADGYLDAREGPVDLDGDCVPGEWPSPGTVGPLLGECEDPLAPEAGEEGDPAAPLRLRDLRPAGGDNGGGTVVTVLGAGLSHPLKVTMGGVDVGPVYVRRTTEAVVVAPRLPAGRAEVAVERGDGTYAPREGLWTSVGPEDGTVPECRLDRPLTLPPAGGTVPAALAGATYRVYARLDAPAAGQDFGLTAELGWGREGADPAGHPDWTFLAAGYLPSAAAEADDEDEYSAEMTLPGPGAWSYGFAASSDGGRTWRTCEGLGRLEVETE